MSRVCVIGAGLGGLALAIRLQARGIACTLIEAQDRPGGWARGFEAEGFTFDTGPAALGEPALWRELWSDAGRELGDDVELLPIAPLCRFHWPDGTQFDLVADDAALLPEIARIAPGDLAGYEDFASYTAEVQAEGFRHRLAAGAGWRPMAAAIPGLLRLQAFRSLHGRVSGFVRSERLRQVLASSPLVTGGNPFTVSAIAAAAHRREREVGLWYPRGGFSALARAMAGLFEALGGELRLGDAVRRIHLLGNRVSAVECASGWHQRVEALAIAADLMHAYRDLLDGQPPGPAVAQRLARRRWSPSVFTVHFALAGSWPGLAHRTLMLGPRFKALLDDIFGFGVLPRDAMIWLSHPSVTDPSLAPPGKSVFQAVMPVAHLGHLPIDWAAVGPRIAARILDEIGRRFIPDIHDRILFCRSATPRDHAAALNLWQGSAYGLEPLPAAALWLQPTTRDGRLGNLFRVGAGIRPGAGIAAVLTSASLAARQLGSELGG